MLRARVAKWIRIVLLSSLMQTEVVKSRRAGAQGFGMRCDADYFASLILRPETEGYHNSGRGTKNGVETKLLRKCL